MDKLVIDCISDTHNQHGRVILPGGDILIHSGDCTGRGTLQEALVFLNWFAVQPYTNKILIAGNHDFIFEKEPNLMTDECKNRNIIYLNDSGCEIEGIKIWGSPIQPWFFNWAFNRQRGEDIKKHWDLIPEDTEILVTHGPPYMILDAIPRQHGSYEHVGCHDLVQKIYQTKVKLHIFGHIHEGAGVKYFDGRTYVNASSLDGKYILNTRYYTRIVKEGGTYLEAAE